MSSEAAGKRYGTDYADIQLLKTFPEQISVKALPLTPRFIGVH